MEDYVYFCRGRFNCLMSSLIFRIQLESRMGSSRRETSVDITDHGWHLDGVVPSSTCDKDLPVPLWKYSSKKASGSESCSCFYVATDLRYHRHTLRAHSILKMRNANWDIKAVYYCSFIVIPENGPFWTICAALLFIVVLTVYKWSISGKGQCAMALHQLQL